MPDWLPVVSLESVAFHGFQLTLREDLPFHVIKETARELQERISTVPDLKIRDEQMVVRPEIAPERRPVRKALARFMEVLEDKGVSTRAKCSPTYPKNSQDVLEVWNTSVPHPVVIVELHLTGWRLDVSAISALIGNDIDEVQFMDLIR